MFLIEKKEDKRYVESTGWHRRRNVVNFDAVFMSHSSRFYTMAKQLIYLNSPNAGDQADILFIAKILFFEKSIIFHLHFRRHKFSFSLLKMA